MGNIYAEQGQYPAAVKQYRMALDQIPAGPSCSLVCLVLKCNMVLSWCRLRLGRPQPAPEDPAQHRQRARAHGRLLRCG